ncbi:MAG: helix-turn-helix domain-containing protein [Anaerolineae bacterium]|nr:helix-turn-helix domain-containing protein [Anaerolineae bacterium]
MPAPLHLSLTDAQREELETLRDTHPLAYLRERAAAVLKLSEGQSGLSIAQHGLLKRRQHGTVYGWVHRYETEGVAGLYIRKGRGRKAAFSPTDAGHSP